MLKYIPVFLLALAFFCTSLRADEEEAPKNIMAMLLQYEGPSNKPFARVFVSTMDETDSEVQKWMKAQHLSLQYCIRVRLTAEEMQKISAFLKKSNLNPNGTDGYHAFHLDSAGDAHEVLLTQPAIHSLFLALADCNIPPITREEMQGCARRMSQ